MSDLIRNVLARSRGDFPVIRPRMPSLFEPVARPYWHARKQFPSTDIRAQEDAEALLELPASSFLTPEAESVSGHRAPTPALKLEPVFRAQSREAESDATPRVTAQRHALASDGIFTPSPAAARPFERRIEGRETSGLAQPEPPHASLRPWSLKDTDGRPPLPALSPGKPDAISSVPAAPHRRNRSGEPTGDENGAQPVIQVTIGRVDVRAIVAEAPRPAPAPKTRSTLSLDSYLQQRDRGSR